MRYEITVRQLETDETLTRDCYFFEINEESYALHLSALVKKIDLNAMVQSTSIENNVISIESFLEEKELLAYLNPLFGRVICHLRFVKIDTSKSIQTEHYEEKKEKAPSETSLDQLKKPSTKPSTKTMKSSIGDKIFIFLFICSPFIGYGLLVLLTGVIIRTKYAGFSLSIGISRYPIGIIILLFGLYITYVLLIKKSNKK